MKPDPVILHCPSCGAALSVAVELAEAKVYSTSTLTFTFKSQDIGHDCEEER